MFGYVRTASEELKVKEFNRYRAYYCGVCRGMSRYTFIGRVLLNYDLAFYALLIDSEAKAEIKVKRCKWNLKKKPYACGEALDYAAALNLLLSCGKLRDRNPAPPHLRSLNGPNAMRQKTLQGQGR